MTTYRIVSVSHGSERGGRLGATGEVLAGWFDLGVTTDPLMAGDMTGGDAVRLAVSVTFWIVVPMAAGVLRVIRREVN
ncbi:hypothetical protein OHA77_35310 [Streptosporangium sp. NBC_01639]|uniref:hypothetical protein n=1 Tax=Streptosporangium sp. NBC_01639 TaxID=2975948 RepID=UPI00386F9E37|nr:hypothetical protein OHA77_35310 [Streptosporangium sp. NBC_01639]